MIDDNLLLSLELLALALMVIIGAWHLYKTRRSTTVAASGPAVHDMRQEGQRLDVRPDLR
jgi:hypothetical protein